MFNEFAGENKLLKKEHIEIKKTKSNENWQSFVKLWL